MKVLVITGDKSFKPGHPRFELQRAAAGELEAVFWGRGSLWPKLPAGYFDVVTVQDPLLRGAFARRTAKKIGARLNVQVHMDLRMLPWWKYLLAHFVLRRADSVRVVSERLKKQVESMGVRAPITVLPIFVDIERFKNVLRLPHSRKAILWVGRFESEKDPFKMLAVFADIRRQVDAKLIMLGTGSLEKSLRAEVARVVLAKDIEFPGWQDPALFLERADVVVCTSWHESWGASMVEALAAGVPVIAPDVGIAKEAGAVVAERKNLAQATIDALHTGARGSLRLPLLGSDEWAQAWVRSL